MFEGISYTSFLELIVWWHFNKIKIYALEMVQIWGCDETFAKKVDQLFLNWHFFAVIHNFLEGLAGYSWPLEFYQSGVRMTQYGYSCPPEFCSWEWISYSFLKIFYRPFSFYSGTELHYENWVWQCWFRPGIEKEKAKVVAAVWGMALIQFFAALDIFHQDEFEGKD